MPLWWKIRDLLLPLVLICAACGPAAERRAEASPPVPATPTVPLERVAQVDRSAEAELRYVASAATLAQDSKIGPYAGRLSNWPITGRITSPFGPRWGGFHTGLDIAAPTNTPVLAAAAGQVVAVGKPYIAYGDTATIVIIAHATDFATIYVHLSDDRPPIVKVGQHVNAGDVIAYCGSTGFSTGPHLHFMTIVRGRASDPIPYLP